MSRFLCYYSLPLENKKRIHTKQTFYWVYQFPISQMFFSWRCLFTAVMGVFIVTYILVYKRSWFSLWSGTFSLIFKGLKGVKSGWFHLSWPPLQHLRYNFESKGAFLSSRLSWGASRDSRIQNGDFDIQELDVVVLNNFNNILL